MAILDSLRRGPVDRSALLDRLSDGQPVDPAEREAMDQQSITEMGEFQKGLRRFGYNAATTSRAFAAGVAEPFAPEWADQQFTRAQEIGQSQPATLAPEVDSFRKVNDLGSAVSYASGALGEGLGSVGTMVAAGLLSRGAAFRAAPAVKNAAQYAGGMAAMLPMEGGETALTLRDNPEAMANTTAAQRAVMALGRGTVNAALENIVPQALFTNAITGTAGRIAAGATPALANIARKAAAGVVGEAGTEAAQEFTGQYAENLAVPGTGYDIERAKEAAVRGAITGGVLGGAGGTIQAARSNIDAAAETAREEGGPAAQDALNRAVAGLDNLVRNPEQVGADMTNATMGSLAEAAARASEVGAEVADRAGPAAASGIDAIVAMKGRMDGAIMGQLTPENAKKYRELTKNFRLLNPSEYELLRDAMETGNAEQINEAVGQAAKLFGNRVPRGTLEGLKGFAKWTKKFGAGVTKAARERRASVDRYSKEEIEDFGGYLRENQPELTTFLLDSQEPAARVQSVRALMAVRDGNVSPKQLDELQEIMQATGLPLADVAKALRSSAERTSATRPQQPAPATLTPQEEQEAWGGDSQVNSIAEKAKTFLTDDVRDQLEELDLQAGPGVTFAEDGTVYDANGNVMDPEDNTNTPYASRELVQRIQSVDTLNGKPNERRPEYNIPIRYESVDGRVTPEQIIRMLGSKDLVDGKEVRREATDEEIAERVKDGAATGYISPVALAANTGKEANEGNPEQGGFKEVFSRFVPDFDPKSTDGNVGLQGYRLLSALASLNSDGIEFAPDQIPQSMWEELGITEDSEPIKLRASLEENGLDMNTVVQRKYRNGNKRDITLGDLLGVNRGKRQLDAQKALLFSLSIDPDVDNIARELNQRIDKDNDQTADATLKGLKSFARKNKLSPNAAVPGYRRNIDERMADSDRKQRFSDARKALKRAYSTELITEDQMAELREYKDDGAEDRPELDELAEYLQTDLEVNWQTDGELVEMLDEFLEAGMWEVDTARDEFEKNEVQEPTEDERFEAAMNSPEGGETRRMKDGIDQQNDAEVRAEREAAEQRSRTGEPAPTTETAGQARIRKAREKAGLAPRPTPPVQPQPEPEPQPAQKTNKVAEGVAEREQANEERKAMIRQKRAEREAAAQAEPVQPTEDAQRVQDEDAADAATDAVRERFTAAINTIESIQDLDTLQAAVASDPDSDLTTAEAQIVNELIEARRETLTTEPLGAYPQRLVNGTEYVKDGSVLARAVRGWAKKYLGGAEVRVVEYDENDADVKEYFAKSDFDRMPLGRAIPANYFAPDTPPMVLLKRNKTKLAGGRYSRMHTLAHEFGHILDSVAFAGAPEEVRSGVNAAYKRLVQDLVDLKTEYGEDNAMFNASSVMRFLPDSAKNSILTGEATEYSGARAIAEGIVARKDRGDRDYILSEPEFFAEQFAKYAMGDPNIFAGESKTVRDYLDRILAGIKQFYEEVILAQDRTAPEFDTFMKWLGTPVAERSAFPDYNPAQFDERQSAEEEYFNGAPTEPTQEQEPPGQEPPQEPPQGPDDPPSPPQEPPPDNEARAKFRKIVDRMLGGRVNVIFGEDLPEGMAAEYVPGRDLDAINEARRQKLYEAESTERILKDPTNKIPIDELGDPAALRAEAKELAEEAKNFRADLAVRGTIRVAEGREAQAGLAEHEAFHAAFDIFFGQGNKEDRKVVTTAFTRGVLSRRLIKYFEGNEAVLAVIDPTSKDFKAEEAAAYAFQVYLHEPGALQMGQKVEGIFNRFLAYLQRLVGYRTYEERAQTTFADLASGKRAERGVSVLRNSASMEESMLDRSRGFAREVGKGIMHMYDTVLSSSYSRLEGSGNVAMAQIARLGYNETGQRGQGMIQLQRLATTKYSNQMKDALHMLDQEELDQLNQFMLLGEDAPGKLAEPQRRLRAIFKEMHAYQVEAGIDDIGDLENYFPMIWNPEKVAEDAQGFVEMLNDKYGDEMALSKQTAEEVRDNILAFDERGHEFQGIFGEDGEPVADSSKRRSLAFIKNEDRLKYMESDLVTTLAHYMNQSVRHAEYVRAYGRNGSRLKELMGEITSTYGGSKTDVDLAKDYIDGLMGNKEVGMSRELKDLYGAMTVYQNVRLLPLSVFSSLVDPLGIAVRTQSMGAAFDAFGYSIRNMFTDFRNHKDVNWTPEMWEQYAADMGTIDMSGTVKSIDKIYTGVTLRGKTREINDGFFKWNLLNGWVKNNHIMATKAAQLYLRRNAEGEMFTGEMRDQNLAEAGVSAEDIVYDEALGRIRSTAPEILGYDNVEQMNEEATADDIADAQAQATRIQQAIHKIVRQSMIQPSSAEMPGWMSNPYLAPIAHLKTFVFGFNATILERLLYEAQRGNYSPIYYAAAYVPGMIAFDFIKGFAGNGGEEPEWKKNWGVSDYLGYGVERSGLMGTGQFIHDMNNDVTRGGGGWETLAGPSIEQATDLMRAMNAKTSQPTQTWMMNAMPVNALYDQWLMR